MMIAWHKCWHSMEQEELPLYLLDCFCWLEQNTQLLLMRVWHCKRVVKPMMGHWSLCILQQFLKFVHVSYLSEEWQWSTKICFSFYFSFYAFFKRDFLSFFKGTFIHKCFIRFKMHWEWCVTMGSILAKHWILALNFGNMAVEFEIWRIILD